VSTSITVTSTDIQDGQALPQAQMSGIFGAGGSDTSPQLSWSGAPEGTLSYGLTVHDPEAPTGSGFWHWAIADLPATCTSLETNAGDEGAALPGSAYALRNDAGGARFLGAAPPAGHGVHHYNFTVHALDVESIGVGPDASPALLRFMMWQHTLATGTLTATAEIPAD
jgi:hypothetical protein